MSTQKITDAMIESVNSSGLTGNMPAIDGSGLTGIAGFPDTSSTNDPTISSNPSGGVGHTWLNKTSGEMLLAQMPPLELMFGPILVQVVVIFNLGIFKDQ